jgi:hypothetical protein
MTKTKTKTRTKTKMKTIHPLRATRSSPLSQGDKEEEDEEEDSPLIR